MRRYPGMYRSRSFFLPLSIRYSTLNNQQIIFFARRGLPDI
ncbi:hypothetical protein [Klebsiella aerogenes EA1509E]|nr:hypothetical protein [Klebsiella aerogenes EA1509E]